MTRALVLATGALGLLFVARAAMIYQGTDPVAFGLVLLIGFVLVLGIGELLARATRAVRLTKAIEALPSPATEASIAGARSDLRAMLSARLIGAAPSPAATSFAPYLVGLLVMIGLLGTFLGLFETLRGAREALGVTGDVAALREGLVAPMAGLSRAFGTSAAGVSASAMLGLGAVIVRRAEAQFAGVFSRYAASALAPLTTQGKMLAALETIATQGAALPEAARSLAKVVKRVEHLEAELVRAQTEASEQAARTVSAVATEIRGDLKASIEAAAKAAGAAVEPLFAEATERAASAAGGALEGIEKAIASEAEARRHAMREHLDAIRLTSNELAKSEAARGTAIEARLDAAAAAIAEAAAQIALEAEQSNERIEAAALARAAQHEAQLTALDASFAEHLGKLGEALAKPLDDVAKSAAAAPLAAEKLVEAARERLDAQNAAQEARDSRIEAAALARAEQHGAQLAALDASFAEHLGTLGEALAKPLDDVAKSAAAAPLAAEKLVEAARERLDAQAAAQEARDSRIEAAALARAEKHGAQLAALDASFAEHLGTLGEALAKPLDDVAKSAAAAPLAAEKLVEAARERLDVQYAAQEARDSRIEAAALARAQQHGAQLAALEEAFSTHLAALGEALAKPLDEVARSTAAGPAAAARLVDQARERLEAQTLSDAARDERLEALALGITAATEAIQTSAVESARAMMSFAKQTDERAAASEARSEARLAALSDRIEETAGAQAERMTDFALRIENARRESAEMLAERLSVHARDVGTSLDATIALVGEASELLRAGSSEMAAASEMFTLAVDRHREASALWLENLNAASAPDAENGAAEETVDRLGAYLDQTREVFDHSLQFQRELFTELRALRSKGSG